MLKTLLANQTKNKSENRLITVALIGNPNSGKSTLFNVLTGLNQRTGNFPGVTVDKHIGYVNVKDTKIQLIDLPGTYSLTPKTIDEKVSVDILLNGNGELGKIDVVLYVADSTNLKRSLYLLSQIIELQIPIVVALNMIDLLNDNSELNIEALTNGFGVPIVGVSTINKIGIERLKELLINDCAINFEPFIGIDQSVIKELKLPLEINSYADWIKVQNSDDYLEKLSNQERQQLRTIQLKEIVERYNKIDGILKRAGFAKVNKSLPLTKKMDAILTHPIAGYFIFSLLLFVVFQAVFTLSSYPMDFIEWVFAEMGNRLKLTFGTSLLTDLLVNGVLSGLSGVLVFIPQIALLFFFIALLEDSGYMARVSLLSDRILRLVGLNGRSVISLISGMACAVPAIMGTRTIKSWKERLITIMVTPFMSCSARLPVFALLIAVAIPNRYVWGVLSLQALTLFCLYMIGFIAAFTVAFVLSKVLSIPEDSSFVMELPVYKIPQLKTIFSLIVEKVRVFVTEAGKIIMIISLVLWLMATFGPGNNNLAGITGNFKNENYKPIKLEDSYIGLLGKKIEPVIQPLGYDWKIGIALITSFAAREVFVGTMATIYSVGDTQEVTTLRDKILSEKNPQTGKQVFSQATGLSLMFFYLFAMQCMSTMAVVYRETKQIKWPIIQFFMMFTIAYCSSFLVYRLFS
jgi:ferrous iron transport protein B